MKIAEHPNQTPSSFGSVLEKIEIMRSSLRWPQSLARPQIEKLLSQTGTLREEVLRLSRTERLVQARGQETKPEILNVKQRREALLEREFQFDGVFGDSPKLIESLEIAEKAAPTDLPVLIGGESGTGKELMAKVIHANGDRADAQLITVNCGAIPDNLLESELFGHKRGAFTGANSDRAGKFESANNGTIFLDEIGELPLNGQVKLLRVLQSNEIQRVGSDQVVKVDARIVAATNRDLVKMCEEGTFREDLYYRLGIIEITIPPLRDRRDEIPLLVEFLSQEAGDRLGRAPVELSRKLNDFLLHYEYPGNIRELRNIIFRLSCLADRIADLHHLPPQVRRPKRPVSATVKSVEVGAAVSGKSIEKPAEAGAVAAEVAETVAETVAEIDAPEKNDVPEAEASASPAPIEFLPNGEITSGSMTEAKRIASDYAEKQILENGLRETGGNVTELARRIDMNRAHVQTLLKKHNISSKDFRRGK